MYSWLPRAELSLRNRRPRRRANSTSWGWGPPPDLITVRGQKVVARADILMAEEGDFQTLWADLARGKEVWEWPHTLRKFYGADPKTLKDPAQRAEAESLEKTRRQLIGKIVSAIAAGKVVACLQSGDTLMYRSEED